MISAVVIYKDGKVGPHSAEAEEVNKIFPPGFYEATTSTIEEENTETTYSWELLIPESLNLGIKR